ncbi:DNA-directed RNA polymerase subunit beta' [Amygdalobacter indicium]|uniref:DNA-directed RNA polymerase subunit beta' n=1 Tax=Amygdalobacter indicium TaxID=3029272 RepID=UPI0027A6F9BE|nr:DNA-directed RNA polymerase subunit beta' [Amygdalobacter indicium]WEG34384.1 DNA-directed RNA polymerase subunit beta' [Amygdalobacter indicium]
MATDQIFESISIQLASPERILEWSCGEVTKPETINYRTLKPERDGLFCERIFGPAKDNECHCGKYKKIRYRGIVCDRCGVEVTSSKVRRERMGHIKLATPVSHIWYFRGIPSRMGLILDITPRNLERVLYFASYIVTDPGETDLAYKQILNDNEYNEAVKKYGRNAFKAGMGGEAVKKLLQDIDVKKLLAELKEQFKDAVGQKRAKLIKRLQVVESFIDSNNRPEWMVLDVLPVLPPDLRPMVQLDGGRFATSDLNDLYRRVINRNNRLKKLLSLGAPQIIVRNEKRMLQEAVDALIDNGRRGRAVTGAGNRPLKSLSDILKGKQGRFRQNLLGKRVDYSGRSVIVVGPELKMNQCGLPKEMAIELFKPFVMRELVKRGLALNIKTAKRLIERANDDIWNILEEVIQDHPVLLNRAPTLHRLGIQAYEPVLVEGRAIKLHPLSCTPFNADFDGDQMAVHLPLTPEAQAEARFLMLAANNLLKPQDGKPVTVPSQDMILGCYYLTMLKPGETGEGKYFSSVEEAELAYFHHDLGLHCKIKVRITAEINRKKHTQIVETTYGRLIFNAIIPQNLGFVDRSKPENYCVPECDFLVDKGKLKQIIDRCIRKNGLSIASRTLDKIKALGYKNSTTAGISIGIFDMDIPEVKQKYLSEAEKKVEFIARQYRRGLLNEEGRRNATIKVWRETTDTITKALEENLDEYNPINMMSKSGARGSISQIKQLAGMRGNMADTSGRTIEIPIKSNLREGMNVLEFFISSHGARKALSDTALKTADSGYLTRRLVDVSQDVIVSEEDCGTSDCFEVSAITAGTDNEAKRVLKPLRDRLSGRYLGKDVLDPNTGEVLAFANTLVSPELAETIEKAGVTSCYIRTVLTCHAKRGICARCYGLDLAVASLVSIGEAVGIVAAQAIGEPGTQLTMRTFHTGGIANSGDDITQGLPRVEELFEARKPKGQAIMCEMNGVVSIQDSANKRKREITIRSEVGEEMVYSVPYAASLYVHDGSIVKPGDLITKGSINPHDILKVGGIQAVQRYIIAEVIKVYENNGVEINDKHVEIIARQMMRMVRIDDPGDTNLPTGNLVDIMDFEEANNKAAAEGKREAVGQRELLGITKASLATESWLSAASFQETTRVLTDAATKGKSDMLRGLKENTIIGTLIPAGTGLKRYRRLVPVPVIEDNRAILEETLADVKAHEDSL